uniref:Uncharacterized protein n=1 Tax=Plectus sambesii TaxID=2011161 RepID=A0A914USP9_9BILA
MFSCCAFRLRQILSDSFIDDGNDDVHGEHNVADDASYEHIDDSAAFASDSFALRLLAVLRSRSSAPPGAVWDAYGEARARTLNTVLHDTSYQFTILVLDSHRLVDALVELSTAEFRIAWLLFENSVAATTVLKQLVLERLRTQVREEIRAVPHDQLVLCTVAFGLFSFTERLKRSVAYAEALGLINEAAHQIRSLFDFEAMCRALEIKCGDAATALLTLTENERRKSILSTNNLLLDSDFSKEEECASIVHGYVVFCFVRDIVRRRKIAQAICRIVDTAEHKGKQLLAERPIHYAHIASILSVLANFRLRLSEASACSALSADVLEIKTIEPKLTTTVKTLLDMVADHYPELYLTQLQSMLSSKTPNDQHLVQSVFACLLQSETNALYK